MNTQLRFLDSLIYTCRCNAFSRNFVMCVEDDSKKMAAYKHLTQFRKAK